MKLIIPLSLIVLSSMSFAATSMPVNCNPLQLRGEALSIVTNTPTLFYINNLANKDLWITHPVTNPSASAGWTSQLQAGRWSALLVNKGPFTLACMKSIQGQEQKIPCEKAIAVCQWIKVKIPKTATSTFWVAENLPLDTLTPAVGSRGFLFYQ